MTECAMAIFDPASASASSDPQQIPGNNTPHTPATAAPQAQTPISALPVISSRLRQREEEEENLCDDDRNENAASSSSRRPVRKAARKWLMKHKLSLNISTIPNAGLGLFNGKWPLFYILFNPINNMLII